jgi:hypothetical protein
VLHIDQANKIIAILKFFTRKIDNARVIIFKVKKYFKSTFAFFTFSMTSIIEQKPTQRDYQLGTCYMCQLCLTCNKELAFNTCKCNVIEKPKNSKRVKVKENFIVEFIIQVIEICFHNYKSIN